MRMRALGGSRRLARWFRNRFVNRALILLYHRVADLPTDPQLLCVTPEHFAEQLEILRKRTRLMRLQELEQALRAGNLPDRAVAVTFDDGYADNLYNAKPLLERYDVPATVFVTTGYIGEDREFWWDELDRLFLQPGSLPTTLRLKVNGIARQWDLGEAAHYAEDARRRHRSWNVLEEDDPGPRQGVYRSLCRLLRPLEEPERRRVLDELVAWAGVGGVGRPTHRALLSDEVVRLAEGGLVEVGAHTVTHPVLATLPTAAQAAEIWESKGRLEKILEHPVTSFAYPYGSRPDYTRETVAAVRKAGFTCACSNSADLVWRGTDTFQLPRVVVRDWDGEAFMRTIDGWFRG